MDLGFEGGFTVFGNDYQPLPYEVVFANDIVPAACETYEHNFGLSSWCGDVNNLDYSMLPDASEGVVVGGFPCQDFSISGKRGGLGTERGNLYQRMRDVVSHVGPVAFVAENVDGLRKSKAVGGDVDASALDHIVNDFASVGYTVSWQVLNAADYGVPQHRVRVIIVGVRSDVGKPMVFPLPVRGDETNTKWLTSAEGIDDLWGLLGKGLVANHSVADYSKAKFRPGRKMQGNTKIRADRPAPTIRSEHHGNIEGHYRSLAGAPDPEDMAFWRRLTVRECARLQSFPDAFEFPVSASSGYKQVGNAVPPVLAWHVAGALHSSVFR